jgi:hypothetical protein
MQAYGTASDDIKCCATLLGINLNPYTRDRTAHEFSLGLQSSQFMLIQTTSRIGLSVHYDLDLTEYLHHKAYSVISVAYVDVSTIITV